MNIWETDTQNYTVQVHVFSRLVDSSQINPQWLCTSPLRKVKKVILKLQSQEMPKQKPSKES